MTQQMPDKVKDKVGCGWRAVCQRRSLREVAGHSANSISDMYMMRDEKIRGEKVHKRNFYPRERFLTGNCNDSVGTHGGP